MSNTTDPASALLDELLALQTVLDDDDDIPILDEPFQVSAVAAPERENPFLPKAMIDKLSMERQAAQNSAEEAHRTMQRIMDRKQEQARTALRGAGTGLTEEQKDTLINELVDEMLPQIAGRLRDRLKILLNR